MRRTKPLLAVTAIVAVSVAAPAALGATGTPTVKLKKTNLGKILVSKRDTLFSFTRDRHGKDKCQSITGCTSIWKPLMTKHKPMAGPGVKASLLGTIKLKNGKKQVTYNKHPLYIYTVAPRGTAYVDVKQFGGHWDALNARGHPVN